MLAQLAEGLRDLGDACLASVQVEVQSATKLPLVPWTLHTNATNAYFTILTHNAIPKILNVTIMYTLLLVAAPVVQSVDTAFVQEKRQWSPGQLDFLALTLGQV